MGSSIRSNLESSVLKGGREMRRFTEAELWAFIERADSSEKVKIATQFIGKLTYLDDVLFSELMEELEWKSERLYDEEIISAEYSPSSPWNAPGMSPRDFVR